MASQTYVRSRPPSEAMAEVESLLGRYPNLSETELATLINLFPTLSILEVGLMTANDRLSGKFEAFHRDHARKIKMPVSSLIAFLAVPGTLMLAFLWWAFAPLVGL
jgi:hypothetical protein